MSDRRAVSTTLSYVLTLAIATLLIVGLITAGGTYVDSQREQVIRDELEVVGQQVAADVERADRLVRAGDTDEPVAVTLNQSLSNRATGSSYELTLVPSDQTLVVNTTQPDISVRIGLTVETQLDTTSARGGDIQIRYDDGAEHLEVRNV